jgi:hypothetical protein
MPCSPFTATVITKIWWMRFCCIWPSNAPRLEK